MSIFFSQSDYLAMFREGGNQQQSNADGSDKYWYYPTHLGRGSIREIKLREGLELTIASYQLYQNLIVEIPEREHPLEYEFTVIGEHHRQLIPLESTCIP